MPYVLICRWLSPNEPEPYNDEIAWLDGSMSDAESLYATMDYYLHQGQRMEILEVVGELDFHNLNDMNRMKAALRKHRKVHGFEVGENT